MIQTNLQQKIEKRAEKRAEQEYIKFLEFIYNNRFCKLLKLKIGTEFVPFICHTYQPLFAPPIKNLYRTHTNSPSKRLLELTNYEDAWKELCEEYIELETNELLNKIDSISDYFNQEN